MPETALAADSTVMRDLVAWGTFAEGPAAERFAEKTCVQRVVAANAFAVS